MLASLRGAALLAIVHQRMGGRTATVYLIGGVASAALLTIAVLLRLALARKAGSGLTPEDARLLASIDAYVYPLLTFPIALQAIAVVGAARRGAVAAWLGAVSSLRACEQLIESSTVFGFDGLFAPGGELNMSFRPTLYLAWILAQGTALARVPSQEQADL